MHAATSLPVTVGLQAVTVCHLQVGVKTAAASGAASLWRIGLTPIDTMKTSLQERSAVTPIPPSCPHTQTEASGQATLAPPASHPRLHTPGFTHPAELQVVGEDGYEQVMAKVKTDGVGALYQAAPYHHPMPPLRGRLQPHATPAGEGCSRIQHLRGKAAAPCNSS